MDKTLMIAKWFYDNNVTVKSDSFDGNILLNKLCYYSKAMFLSLDKNIIQQDIEAWKNGPVLPYVYTKYKSNNLLDIDCDSTLTEEEIKILKIINRVFGYLKIEEILKQTQNETPWSSLKEKIDQKLNPIITNESLLNEYKDQMLELYEYYKDEELDEKLEIINGKYFFITSDIILTDDEYSELSNIKINNENVTYYVFRDSEGSLMVY